MTKYIKKLLGLSFLFVLLLLTVAVTRIIVYQLHSWKLPAEKHILFMGASHINHGIDDEMLKSSINWTRGSERYMYTYIKLFHLLEENSQIDTIFLECAPTDLWEDADYKYHVLNEQSGYVKLYWPYFSLKQWKIFKSEPVQVIGLVASSLLRKKYIKQSDWWESMGGFTPNNNTLDMDDVHPSHIEANGYGHAVNYEYLRKIIDICKEYKVKLYFLYCPMYHPELFYDQDYFYRAYKENFFDVELLDYSHWNIESDCFADPHHLNSKGSRLFTQELMNRFNLQ